MGLCGNVMTCLVVDELSRPTEEAALPKKRLVELPPPAYEPRHEIFNNVVYATSKASDQPAHTRSLIRAFASRLNILRKLSY